MLAELTLEQKAVAIALAEFLKAEGYILSAKDKEELERYRQAEDSYISGLKAAEMIGCSPARVIALRQKGLIKYKLEGTVPKYSVKSIKAYNKSRMI